MKIKNVAIVGGTHGNEFTGVYLLKKLSFDSIKEKNIGLNIHLLLANPKAFEMGVRGIDDDLNRSFLKEDLENETLTGYEAERAKSINKIFGPKDSPKVDFIMDVHTTTANMGVTIFLISINSYNYKLVSYIKSKIPSAHICYISSTSYTGGEDYPFLHSLSSHGFVLEIGPVPNGIVRHDILEQAENVVNLTLEFINLMNSGKQPETDGEFNVFVHKDHVLYPEDDDGNIIAFIHRDLQDKDYQQLRKGDPVFKKLSGEIIRYDNDQVMYPVFINEAAYYSKKIAFSLTEKTNIKNLLGNDD